MSKFIVCTRNPPKPPREAYKLQKLVCWLLRYPARGDGLPENIDADPGDGRPDIKGWATRFRDFYRSPGNTGADTDQFALELDTLPDGTLDPDDPIVAAWQTRKGELHALLGDTVFSALQTWIQNHLTTATVLAATWYDADGNLDNSEDIVPDKDF